MTTEAAHEHFPPPVHSILIAGGHGAPARARRYLLTRLDAGVSTSRAADAALIVSELVTNSVLHAEVGADRAILLELTALGDRLRIAVIDPGSHLEPRILPANPDVPGGFGLRLVHHMSSAWGVIREAAGPTRVWCELPLDRVRAVTGTAAARRTADGGGHHSVTGEGRSIGRNRQEAP
jgi:anti-sigma regulatory factor (Ser/Thr protein kinase)